MSNNVKSRIQMKADTSENWKTAGNNGFIPLKNEAIFYTDKNNMKLGDGVTNINQLDFFIKSDDGSMKYMGVVSSLPTGLTLQDKGKTYKANFDFSATVVIVETPFYGGDSMYSSTTQRFDLPTEVPGSGYCYINYVGNREDIQISLICEYDDYDWEGNPITAEESIPVMENGYYSPGYYGGASKVDITLQSSDWDEGYYYNTSVSSLIFSTVEIPEGLAGKQIKKGDLVIWTGSAWDVIPSGDDVLDTTELKSEIIAEMEDYVDNAILNGAW